MEYLEKLLVLILTIFCYPRKHKKGLEEDVTKKRTRRAQKFQRAVVGATLQARDLYPSISPEYCFHISY